MKDINMGSNPINDLLLFQELLGLGLTIPGMATTGTMDREDSLSEAPPRFRETLAVRPEANGEANDDGAASEEGSEVMNESVVSRDGGVCRGKEC